MEEEKEERPKVPYTKDVAPTTASAYLDPTYWDERFDREKHYEWLKDYSHFQHLIQQHIPSNSSSSVLELGCGNSKLSEELFKHGIRDITCTDLSPIAVRKMQQRLLAEGFTDIKVLVADMLELPFANDSYDVVIEKGTMDVLFVDSGDPWNPRNETVKKVMAMLKEVHRVLKKDGIYVSISFGQPHFRRPLFEAPEFTWSMDCHTFGDGFHYFFYVLQKGRRLVNNSKSCRESSEKPSINLYQDELENENYLFRTNVEELEN